MNEIIPYKKNYNIKTILFCLISIVIVSTFVGKFVLADNQQADTYEDAIEQVENYRSEKSEILAYLSGQISQELLVAIENEESITQEKLDAVLLYHDTHYKLKDSIGVLQRFVDEGNKKLGK